MSDIISIPVSSHDYINESNNITQKQIDNITFIGVLSPLNWELNPGMTNCLTYILNPCLDKKNLDSYKQGL